MDRAERPEHASECVCRLLPCSRRLPPCPLFTSSLWSSLWSVPRRLLPCSRRFPPCPLLTPSLSSDTDRAGCGNMCGEAGGWNCFCCVCFCFRKKATIKRRSKYWAILKNSALLFYKDRGCEKLMDVVHFQQTTVVSDQLVSTGSRHGVVIIDSSWMAEMKLDSTVSQRQWFTMLKFHIVSSCPWVAKDRFKYGSRFSGSLLTYGSMSCLSQWFLNPKDLWIQIMNSILSAKEEVLIAGWWISPEIYLQRPGMKYPESRLDKIIGKVAKRGVKVKILQYREPKVSTAVRARALGTGAPSLLRAVLLLRRPGCAVLLLSLAAPLPPLFSSQKPPRKHKPATLAHPNS